MSLPPKISFKLLSLSACVVAFSGCGGGGGGGGGGPAAPAVVVNANAIDGLVAESQSINVTASIGGATSVSWQLLSGPADQIRFIDSNPSDGKVQIVAPMNGTFTIRVSATNGTNSGSDTAEITFNVADTFVLSGDVFDGGAAVSGNAPALEPAVAGRAQPDHHRWQWRL